jgi:NAD(P)H dehydrogenase (quinone)
MSVRVVVVYHSEGGRTKALAEAVVRGAVEVEGVEARTLDVSEARREADVLAEADAIVFGSPTYMGSASAAFKSFMDGTAPVWALQGWRDKLAAGFTHSAAPSGDKLGTLLQLAIFAAQHGMIWVGLGLPPSYASASGPAERDDLNRLGSHLGAMAQSPPGSGARPSEGDLRTCVHLGRRVAEHAVRFSAGGKGLLPSTPPRGVLRAPEAATWRFPPDRAALAGGARRTNLRELAARPGRFEHHLIVVARAGNAQLEIATASEPLYFAHINVSDEYAVALPTGDDLIDRFPMRTFLTDPETAADVARYNHRVGDLLLHPLGLMHWPGRLRPPFEPFVFPKGMRRCGLSLVLCAPLPTIVGDRPLFVSEGRAGDAKSYVAESPPLVLGELTREGTRIVARVGDASLSLVVRPIEVTAPRGAYVVVLEADAGSPHHACDLIHLGPGARLDTAGVLRALVFSSDVHVAEPPPLSWDCVADPPFAPFEEGERSPLPFDRAGVEVTESDPAHVAMRIGGVSAVVPRHWLTRMLFRVALHQPMIGYVETYGGFFYDDRPRDDGAVRIGLRGGHPITISRADGRELVEALYRAVAPEGYAERCSE